MRQLGSFSAPSGISSRRSEEHTSELQSRGHLVCRLLLEKKKRYAHRRRKTAKRTTTRSRFGGWSRTNPTCRGRSNYHSTTGTQYARRYGTQPSAIDAYK